MKFLTKIEPQAYALLRITSGFMFALHGVQKIFGLLTERPAIAPADYLTQRGLAGWIELVAGALIMLGVKTREAAFISSGTMAVAYFQAHWKFQLGGQFFPIVNRGELAALYCFVFLLIAAKGSGIWALKKD
jgi:putative oxidoreductase